ncbi:hypothetical protein AAFQ97_09605 [Proteus terrae]|uniref:hypothetical protein n=1 Tax=Proteus TaxID=583 RepID=UPI00203468A5|nr:hypothetical protein [Proteus sp. FZP2095]MCM2366516.1 hypothetical protein [Proteus sp. FZP2095]
MDNALLFLKDNAVAVGIALTAVGLIGGAIGASIRFLIDNKKIANDKKSIHQQMITNNIAPMRQEWINDIRNKSSVFLSNCDFIIGYKLAKFTKEEDFIEKYRDSFKKSLFRHSELYLYLKMALPFSRDGNNEVVSDAIRSHLEYINDRLNERIGITSEIHDEIINAIQCCAENFKILLKNEWNETKSLKEINSEKHSIEKLPPPECTCSVKNK